LKYIDRQTIRKSENSTIIELENERLIGRKEGKKRRIDFVRQYKK
jgi:hypothetical protein